MVKGDQKMMLKRFLVTAFACMFVMAFGLGQVAYGADGNYTGTLQIKNKIYDWDTKADNEKFKDKYKDLGLTVNATGTGDLVFETIVTDGDGNYTCDGIMGDQAFWLHCHNLGALADDNSTTHIFITGKVEESEKGKLKFYGKGTIENFVDGTILGVGHCTIIKGKFLPEEVD